MSKVGRKSWRELDLIRAQNRVREAQNMYNELLRLITIEEDLVKDLYTVCKVINTELRPKDTPPGRDLAERLYFLGHFYPEFMISESKRLLEKLRTEIANRKEVVELINNEILENLKRC